MEHSLEFSGKIRGKKRRLPLVGRSKSQLLQNEKLVGSCYGVRVKYIIGISFVRFGLKDQACGYTLNYNAPQMRKWNLIIRRKI